MPGQQSQGAGCRGIIVEGIDSGGNSTVSSATDGVVLRDCGFANLNIYGNDPNDTAVVLSECVASGYLRVLTHGRLDRCRADELLVSGSGQMVNCIAETVASVVETPPVYTIDDCVVRNTIAPYLELTTSDPNDLDELVSDYNDFYGDPNGNEAVWKEDYSDPDPNEYATLATWQSDTGQDAHSISADPVFNDDPNGDYTLASTSPCIDRGSPTCPARVGHGGRMDMGMYEYDSRTGGTAASLAYDNAGNLTADGDKEYYYDVLGRLTLAESGLNSNVKLAAYRYDALGRLAMQVTYDYVQDGTQYYDESNTTRYYYYDTPVAGGDGASSPVLPQVVEVKDGSGDTTDQFVWAPAYVDELLLHERDTDDDGEADQRLYAAHDTLYSVLRLVDEDGNVVERYSYSPYGSDPTDPRKGAARITDADDNELTPDDSVAEYLYTGRQFDKAVGLNYHRARRLSHNLGRWTRRDPIAVCYQLQLLGGRHIEGQGSSLTPFRQYDDGANLYAYVSCKALRLVDPAGGPMIDPREIARCVRDLMNEVYDSALSNSLLPDYNRDSWMHCKVSCKLGRGRCGPIALILADVGGLLKEFADMADPKWDGLEDFISDWAANGEGRWCSFKFWRSCGECCTCKAIKGKLR